MGLINGIVYAAGITMMFGGAYLGVLVLPHVPRTERPKLSASAHARTSSNYRPDGSKDDIVDNIDVDKVAYAIRLHECNGGYTCVGKDGEYGGYQIISSYWPALSRQAFGDVRPPTPANQDAVAKAQISKLVSQGYSVRQIALIWNGGTPREKKGISRGGVPYDSGAYADWIVRKYRQI